jgi:hypothetical protein
MYIGQNTRRIQIEAGKIFNFFARKFRQKLRDRSFVFYRRIYIEAIFIICLSGFLVNGSDSEEFFWIIFRFRVTLHTSVIILFLTSTIMYILMYIGGWNFTSRCNYFCDFSIMNEFRLPENLVKQTSTGDSSCALLFFVSEIFLATGTIKYGPVNG